MATPTACRKRTAPAEAMRTPCSSSTCLTTLSTSELITRVALASLRSLSQMREKPNKTAIFAIHVHNYVHIFESHGGTAMDVPRITKSDQAASSSS